MLAQPSKLKGSDGPERTPDRRHRRAECQCGVNILPRLGRIFGGHQLEGAESQREKQTRISREHERSNLCASVKKEGSD